MITSVEISTVRRLKAINVHKYGGAHIFHTSNKKCGTMSASSLNSTTISNSPVANYKGNLYQSSLQHMILFYAMWEPRLLKKSKDKIAEQTADMKDVEPKNLEELSHQLIGQVSEKLIRAIQKNNGDVLPQTFHPLSSNVFGSSDLW